MNRPDENSWIDRVMEHMASSSSGDTIVGSIGSAQTAAIGKNIVQVTNVLGQPQPGDSEEVSKAISQLRAEFQRLIPQLSDATRYVAEDKIDTLEHQLKKNDGAPSGDLIRTAGSWLVDHIPQVGGALVSTFLPEPVGRVVEAAGAATVEWVKNLRDRFGS